MEYGLTRLILDKKAFLPLDHDGFERARAAKDLIVEALGGEEKFNLLLENFAEYESELLQLALHGIVFADTSWSDSIAKIHTINRRLLNVLSAGRLYLDQTRHSVSSIFGDRSPELGAIKTKMSEEYDARFGYRVMEALRNFVQHRGLGVHHITHQSWWVELEDEHRCRHTLVPSLQIRDLQEAGGFKSSVLEELEEKGERVDLRPLVREYVTGIARVQEEFRRLCRSKVEDATGYFAELMARYREEGEEDILGLAAVQRAEDGTIMESVQIFEDLLQRRTWLAQKNSRSQYVDKHFVIGESKHRINGG